MPRYTDIENTGMPVVPDLRTDADRQQCLEETVQSHRLPPTDD
ncbi:hypothetical protein [Halobacterium wangiae]|nr:hypothetical protein [Halobacterium wangiae]